MAPAFLVCAFGVAVEAATKVWADIVLRRRNPRVESQAEADDSLAATEAAPRTNPIDLGWVLPPDLLAARRLSPALAGLLLLVPALCWSAAPGSEASGGPAHLNIGYSAQVFVDVTQEEARSLAKVWSDQILKRRFGEITLRTLVLPDVASLEAAFRRKEVDVAAVIVDEYVALKARVPLQAVFVPAHDGGVYQNVVLLVRRDGGVRQIGDLRSKQLTVSVEQVQTIHLKWLEILLMREGFRTAESFFSRVREAKGPSQAILSVFFKQSDACLTMQQAFDLASELNPQIGRELVPLASSPGSAGGVIVFRPDYGEADKTRLMDVLATLHLDPQGRQLLHLFRMSSLIPFKPEYLEAVESFRREHESLRRKLAPGRAR